MHKYINHLVQRIILLCILKLKFLHVVEVGHLSYPCVNLWINYAYINSDQIDRTRQLDQNCKMPMMKYQDKKKLNQSIFRSLMFQ